MPLAAAVAGAAIIGGGASIIGANKASKTAKSTAAANNAIQQDTYAKNSAVLSPFIGAGQAATGSINGLLGLGGDPAASAAAYASYKGSTEYTSRLKEGQDSVTAGLGARGLLDSGAAQKALLRYGQTFASNDFGQYLGNLQQQQGVGLSAASAQAGVGTNLANSVSANNNAAANTVANAALTNASTINGVLNNAVGAYGISKGYGSSYGGGY